MLPRALTTAPLRAVRPQDLADIYTQPSVQLERWVRTGRVNRLARGVYYALPDDQEPGWIPTMETATAAVATVFVGNRVPILMHLSAARLHGAVPRALAVGIVAVPRQLRPMQLTDRDHGRVVFVKRKVEDLDAVLMPTDLGDALVTTPEQTLLDLIKRPTLGGVPTQVDEAIGALLPRVDPDRVTQLAVQQRGTAAWNTLRNQLLSDGSEHVRNR